MKFSNALLQSAPQPLIGSANLTGQQWLIRVWWNARLNDGAGGWLVDLFFANGSSQRTTDSDGNALPRSVLVYAVGVLEQRTKRGAAHDVERQVRGPDERGETHRCAASMIFVRFTVTGSASATISART